MYGHGNSDPLPSSELAVGGTGMYDAVQLVADLPYVDRERIGVSGHSNGARAANWSVQLDDTADEQLISSVLLVDNDPIYRDESADNAYANVYGARDVGLIQAQYDEFFFRSYDADGNVLTPPREYPSTPNAQSFLHFGADPDGITDVREASQVYVEDVDGEQAMRVLHSLPQTHPWTTISSGAVGHLVDFFDESLGAPDPIPAGSQVWQVKEAFTALGLVGFGIFLVAFTRALLLTRAFAGLRSPDTLAVPSVSRRGLAWFWGGLVLSALVSGVSYIWLSQSTWITSIALNAAPNPFPRGAVFFIAFWAAVNGLATVAIMTASYLLFGRRNGQDVRAVGLLPGWRRFFQGIGLAIVSTAAAYLLVFVLDYLFTTDFRLWVLAVKAFEPEIILYALIVLPLFLVYFVANSVAINAFNRFAIRGKEWVNTALLALFNALAPDPPRRRAVHDLRDHGSPGPRVRRHLQHLAVPGHRHPRGLGRDQPQDLPGDEQPVHRGVLERDGGRVDLGVQHAGDDLLISGGGGAGRSLSSAGDVRCRFVRQCRTREASRRTAAASMARWVPSRHRRRGGRSSPPWRTPKHVPCTPRSCSRSRTEAPSARRSTTGSSTSSCVRASSAPTGPASWRTGIGSDRCSRMTAPRGLVWAWNVS